MSGTIFLLGATGFAGSTFLISLGKNLPQYHVVALTRGSSAASLEARTKSLKAHHPNLSVVEGTLEDEAIIRRESAKVDIVVNCASSDHLVSIRGILDGLEDRQKNTGSSPIFIHVSGYGLISDNSRGQPPGPSPKVYTDIGFSPNDCPEQNPHREVDNFIIDAATRTQNSVRTLIFYPGWIYGVGEAIGLQRTTLALRIYTEMAKQFGYVGTFAAGLNGMQNIHVKDCASALLIMLQAAIDGRADVGTEGIYFGSSEQPIIPHVEITNKIGDILHAHGTIPLSGSQPMKPEHASVLTEGAWSAMGGNLIANPQRLRKFGWEPVESRKLALMDSLPEELKVAIKEWEVLTTDNSPLLTH
ncbi:NAD(P)-binding protein [Pluteus cervinus]|uniref:NAD(P)-binding protein n=1 Tax=Pluteus cervinus TaxID=181527 RepID=A0ACD3BE08_9AGAR|nr:NAD(P)-binding protein [Pluteus cervinus]